MTLSAILMAKDKTFQIRINSSLQEKAAVIAQRKGISLAEWVRYLIIREIESDEKSSRST